MRFFLSRTIVFVIAGSILFLFVGFFQLRVLHHFVYSDEALKLSPYKKILFIGDSHAMSAFNDSLIPNSFNASRNSESLFQTYNKLEALLKANPQITTVVLSFSPHNVAKQADEGILYGDRYWPVLNSDSRRFIANALNNKLLPANTGGGVRAYAQQLKHYLIVSYLTIKWNWGLPQSLNNYMDYFLEAKNNSAKIYYSPIFTLPYKSTHSNLDDNTIKKTIHRHYGTQCDTTTVFSINYFWKIIETCEKQDLKLVLVNTPQHQKYRSQIPEYNLKVYNHLVSAIQSNVHYLDFSDLPLADKYYGDGDHLNYNGNIIFSDIIAASILFDGKQASN